MDAKVRIFGIREGGAGGKNRADGIKVTASISKSRYYLLEQEGASHCKNKL
jgi:hypothetical protein